MDLHEIFREGWQWANEQMIKVWWQSGSPSGCRDCFPDLTLLGDTESGHYNTGKTRLGGSMHCPSASS